MYMYICIHECIMKRDTKGKIATRNLNRIAMGIIQRDVYNFQAVLEEIFKIRFREWKIALSTSSISNCWRAIIHRVEERENDISSLISENIRVQAEGQRIVERRIREYDKIHCRRSSAAIVRHHCLSAHTAMIRSTIPRITARDDAIISAKCLTGGRGEGGKSGFHIAVEIFSKIHLEDNYWRYKKQQERVIIRSS